MPSGSCELVSVPEATLPLPAAGLLYEMAHQIQLRKEVTKLGRMCCSTSWQALGGTQNKSEVFMKASFKKFWFWEG